MLRGAASAEKRGLNRARDEGNVDVEVAKTTIARETRQMGRGAANHSRCQTDNIENQGRTHSANHFN